MGCGMVMVLVGSPWGYTMGWAVRRAMGRTMGCAMTGALIAVPVGRVAGAASLLFALTSLGCVVTLTWSLFASQSSSPLFAQCSKMV